MSEINKTYRIRTDINSPQQYINVDFTQNYDKFEILSLEIRQSDSYRLMNSNTGVIIGRVLANEGLGVPNAKVSVFVGYDNEIELNNKLRYHYISVGDLNEDGIRYNLLPDTKDDSCQQAVGTIPSKRYLLDNDDLIEVFDKYYTYTTRTNNSGDYMIYGVPTGNQRVHCDIDLSDIGVLSQTPRDLMYKGYPANLFDSPTKFKTSTNLNSLPQIISQDSTVFVYPFWGNTTDNPIGAAISRCDVNIPYKFEPTCLFLGSIITDTGSNAITKKCVPSKVGGKMSEMTSGAGMIEMIRKTVDGDVEQIAVKGNEVIDDNGVWCYQIPMNLDYVMTDEYGNTVISDNPNKGVPTRTRVRFRISMHSNPADGIARKRARYLVPNNPRLVEEDYPSFYETKTVDYEFGSKTKEEDFRDLMWNNVYTVKNYIPRIQKARLPNNLKFSGIKMTNHPGKNNPMPYNKLSIKFNFMYTFMCVLIKTLVQLTRFANIIINGVQWMLLSLAHSMIAISNRRFWPEDLTILAGIGQKTPDNAENLIKTITWTFPDSNEIFYGCNNQQVTITLSALNDGKGTNSNRANKAAWCGVAYFLWACCVRQGSNPWNLNYTIRAANLRGLAAICCALVVAMGRGITLNGLCDDENGNTLSITPGPDKTFSPFLKFIDGRPSNIMTCFYGDNDVSKLYNCVENQLAQDNEVTSFNFYNDWINGSLYMPLWFRKLKPKRKFLGINLKAKDQWCNGNERAIGAKTRKLKVYGNDLIARKVNGEETLLPLEDDYNTVNVTASKANNETGREDLVFKEYSEKNCYGYKCHKYGRSETPIYSGLIIEKETIKGEHVYYYKASQFTNEENEMVTLFATDIVLLGSLNSCDLHGIPQFFKILEGTSYQMPSDLLSEDYDYKSIADVDNRYNTDENEDYLIDKDTRVTEYTGADWGNLGVDQSNMPPNGRFETNENIYDNGGLFYGITCFDSYTKPKSIINLERICEIGVSLDESQDILKSKLTLTSTTINGNDDNDMLYTTLPPDGYISYDEIYNPDYRSMFATMNGNFLKTKLNYETGLVEYDLTHQYLDNFDGSLSEIMAGKTTHGTIVVDGVDTKTPAKYINNNKLEVADKNYIRFRFGDYLKHNKTKLYFYQHKKVMTLGDGFRVESQNKFPRYENSFYFYFGLHEGKTAIDKFYSEYYADCGEEANLGKSIDITHVGNDWCSEDGGYIKFETNLQQPISIEMTDGDKRYTANDIYANRFFIGNGKKEIPGFTYIEVELNNTVPSPMRIASGDYNITITDGYGIEHYETISFYNEDRIEYTIEKFDFTQSNDNLRDSFGGTEDYRVFVVTHESEIQNHESENQKIKVVPHTITILGSGHDGTKVDGYEKYGEISEGENGGIKFKPDKVGYTFDSETKTLKDASNNVVQYNEYIRIDYKDTDDNTNIPVTKNTVVTSTVLKVVTRYKPGYSDLTPTDEMNVNFYNRVADSGGGIENRDIYGYIKISDINVDKFKNFQIRIKPSEEGALDGFGGVEVNVYNATDEERIIKYQGHGYLGNDDNEYFFGMPYGNVEYVVEVIYLCETNDGSASTPQMKETKNVTTKYVRVNEGAFKMFINGIDYDLIKFFKTGWTVKTMDTISNATFSKDDINGWDDIDNIGLKTTEEGYEYPIQPIINVTVNDDVYTYEVSNLNVINGLWQALSDNSGKYYKPSAYNWVGDYKIDNQGMLTFSEAYINLLDDANGKKPDDKDWVPTYEGELADACDLINTIIGNRIELTRMMQGTFRLNSNNSLEIEITTQTQQTPVHYIIVNGLGKK